MSASKTVSWGASMVDQWWRICLPMQETRVRSLIWEDPTCLGASKPMSHNYRAWAPQLQSPHVTTTEAGVPQSLCPTTREAATMTSLNTAIENSPCSLQPENSPCSLQLENSPCPPQLEKSPCSLQPEKCPHNSEDPAHPKIKIEINKYYF